MLVILVSHQLPSIFYLQVSYHFPVGRDYCKVDSVYKRDVQKRLSAFKFDLFVKNRINSLILQNALYDKTETFKVQKIMLRI